MHGPSFRTAAALALPSSDNFPCRRDNLVFGALWAGSFDFDTDFLFLEFVSTCIEPGG